MLIYSSLAPSSEIASGRPEHHVICEDEYQTENSSVLRVAVYPWSSMQLCATLALCVPGKADALSV